MKVQGLKVGLWSVWLSGSLLIALSLYSTQRLPSIKDQIHQFQSSDGPSVTIFCVPKSFVGSVGDRQVFAVRSWLALSPDVKVVLFGTDPSLLSVAAAIGSRVSVEPTIDFTFLGSPFFHSMMARALASASDISVLIDPEIVLLPDFMSALRFSHKLDQDWFLIANSPNISHFPFVLDENEQWLHENGKLAKLKKLQAFLNQKGQWFRCSERILMAWNNGGLPLHSGVLPPFLYGKGLHNQWLLNEALASDYRFVFDATNAISSFYLDDLLGLPNREVRESHREWEIVGNSLLGGLYGSLYFHGAKFSRKLGKFVRCDGRFLFVDERENVPYSSQDQGVPSLWDGGISRSRRENRRMKRGEQMKLLNRTVEDCFFRELYELTQPLPLPSLKFSLESLLSIVADKDRTVVLAIAGNNYQEMLMSWVCRLRHLSITNFVVSALDDEIYKFSVLQGLPVFRESMAPSNISYDDCHFGTKCFQRVTKVKSRLVLRILKMGYNVLLSDVDVYWFKDPLPHLRSFGPAVLAAQSDEYKEEGPINLPRRLNSGFYFARSDNATIAAMEKVVKHAMASALSEQPSFYDVLCGEGGANRLGDNMCVEPETNLTIHFLDRNLFPNGAYHGLWEKADVKGSCKHKGCIILHNNWISGMKKKLERQSSSGLWEYDVFTRMCLQKWHNSEREFIF
ncbi:hypothetical protein Syun_020431 [Stephania yunnanensis]|uniref:Nucleotide-diphospho-sugar transferase domain-containing protein n=1 Tax=Stephania yunnanensis TaxID=152371 RepID=A0AAP0NPM9_9MAGN